MQRKLTSSLVASIAASSLLAACGVPANDNPVATGSRSNLRIATDSATTTQVTTTVPATTTPLATLPASAEQPFTSPDGDYTVVFPATPEAKDQSATLPDGSSLTFTTFIASPFGSAYATGAIVYPANAVLSLEGARDGSISETGATLTSTVEITLQGRNGIQYSGDIAEGQGTMLTRIYGDGSILYMVTVIRTGQVTFDDPRVVAFFDSFRFTVDK